MTLVNATVKSLGAKYSPPMAYILWPTALVKRAAETPVGYVAVNVPDVPTSVNWTPAFAAPAPVSDHTA